MSLPVNQDTLTKIGIFILDGMSEAEACILSNVSYLELQEKKNDNEIIRNFLEKKFTEFKYNHIQEIQKSKSEKNSQWLLEKLRPDEFGSRAKQPDGPTINIISAIIKDIQNDNQGLIAISRGNREQTKSDSISADPKVRIHEALNG